LRNGTLCMVSILTTLGFLIWASISLIINTIENKKPSLNIHFITITVNLIKKRQNLFQKILFIDKVQSDEVDFIVVGQGLSGSVLVNEMLQRKLRFIVIENFHKNTASHAAIGMHNPLIIKRLRKSWMARQLISESKKFYASCQKMLGQDYRRDLRIFRPFDSSFEQNTWREKALLPAWEEYISIEDIEIKSERMAAGEVHLGGWLDIPKFIEASEKLLSKEGKLIMKKFEFTQLKINNENVLYENIKAKHIIFCEGYKMYENPFFDHLPMQMVKGEILIVEDRGLDIDFAIKGAFYIVPIGNHKYKVGATFEWEKFDESVSTKARDELLQAVQKYFTQQHKIVGQIGGVRPTVKDRRPLVGTHKEHPRVHILNGMGTRGVILAPFFSKQLIDHIIHQKEIMAEAAISRFN